MKQTLAIFFLVTKVFAQTLEKGPDLNIKRDKYFDRMLGEDKNGFYELRFDFKSDRKTFFVNQYNKTTLKKIRGVEIGEFLLEDEGNYNADVSFSYTKFISSTYLIKGKFYVFSKSFDRQNHTIQLVLDLFSTNNGEQLESNKVLTEFFSYGNNIYERVFNLSLNNDSSKILVVSHNNTEEKDQIAVAELFSLDGLTKIWNKPLMKKLNGNPVKSRVYQIDPFDNLYYFFVYNNDTTKNSFNNAGLAIVSNTNTTEKILPFHPPQNTITYDASMQYNAEDSAVFFTSNFKDSKTIESRNAGIIYTKISVKTFSIEFSNYQYFSNKTKNTIECNSLNQNITKCDFAPIKLIKINGEYYFYTYIDSHSMKNFVLYHNSEMVVVFKLNSKGESIWQTLIPRSTYFTYVTSNNDPTGISAFTQNDNLCFLFIDHPNNKEIINDVNNFDYCKIKPIGSFPNNVITMSVDKNGSLKRKYVYSNDKDWVIPSNTTIKTDKNSFIMRYKAMGKESFAKLSID